MLQLFIQVPVREPESRLAFPSFLARPKSQMIGVTIQICIESIGFASVERGRDDMSRCARECFFGDGSPQFIHLEDGR